MRLSKTKIDFKQMKQFVEFVVEMTNKGYEVNVSKDLTRIVGRRLKRTRINNGFIFI